METESLTLYDCRNCGAITSVKMGGCPVCDYNESEEYEANGFNGETVTKTRPWYETIDVVVER